MKYFQKNQGFSIILAIGLTLLFSMISLYLIEYMVPFSRNVKGVENASNAFYQSYGAIENALYFSSQNAIGNENQKTYSASSVDYSYVITASGTLIPKAGKGDSDFNTNYNQISQGSPIQLVIGKGRLSSGVARIRLFLQTPDFDGVGGSDSLTSTGVVLWQLSSNTKSLSSQVLLNTTTNTSIWDANGIKAEDQSGAPQTFSNFYGLECIGANECVLKISVIKELVNSISGAKLPYLEYRITTTQTIPLRDALILAEGKSNGFVKNLEIHVPQLTTNSAFDFTVFQ